MFTSFILSRNYTYVNCHCRSKKRGAGEPALRACQKSAVSIVVTSRLAAASAGPPGVRPLRPPNGSSGSAASLHSAWVQMHESSEFWLGHSTRPPPADFFPAHKKAQMRERGDFGVGHNTWWYMPGSKIPPDKADGVLLCAGVMRQPPVYIITPVLPGCKTSGSGSNSAPSWITTGPRQARIPLTLAPFSRVRVPVAQR